MKKYEVIACDLDGTLAPSKAPLQKDMSEVISKTLTKSKMAVISGASYDQFKNQFLDHLSADPEKLRNLFLFPVNGSAFYSYNLEKGWQKIYKEELSESEKKMIYDAFGQAVEQSGVDIYDPYGPVDILEDRGGQITFSGRGQDAPLSIKEAWDPDEKKRKKIVDILKNIIPQFEIRIGGATSIDITRNQVNKAYAISKIEQYLKVSKENILFIGDALFPGGNDATAKETGVECMAVSGPEETLEILRTYAES